MTKPTLLLDAHLKALHPAHLFARIRQSGAALCPGRPGLSPLPVPPLRARAPRSRAARRRASHQAAKFPVLKSLETFEFPAIPSLNKRLVLELARSEYLDRRENVLALGNAGTGKTHLALALGLAACQQGYRVRFTTAAALVNDLLEARDDKRLLRLQKQLAKQDLLIVDELGYVPLSKTTAELLFEIFSQRYEQASTLVTSNLPFNEWTEIFGSERLPGALLDRLTHHVHILELNGDSYRLEHSKKARPHAASPAALTPPPHDGAGCAHGFPLRLSPPQGRSQTPLQPVRTTALRHSARRPGGLVFLRHPWFPGGYPVIGCTFASGRGPRSGRGRLLQLLSNVPLSSCRLYVTPPERRVSSVSLRHLDANNFAPSPRGSASGTRILTRLLSEYH